MTIYFPHARFHFQIGRQNVVHIFICPDISCVYTLLTTISNVKRDNPKYCNKQIHFSAHTDNVKNAKLSVGCTLVN